MKRVRSARGISLIEVTISMVIVSIMSVGMVQTLGIAANTRSLASDRIRGHHLAMDMLSEIRSKAWHDPDRPGTALGPDPGEFDGKTRLAYNDIDDYHNWTQSPPLLPNGDPVPGFAGWERSVTVQYATVSGSSIVVSGNPESGKLITVTVKRSGRRMAEVRAYVTGPYHQIQQAALPPEGEVIP